MFDDFIQKEIAGKGSVQNQATKIDHVLTAVFQDVLTERQYSVDSFIETIHKRSERQSHEIERILNPILNRKSEITGWGYDFVIYWNTLGFVVIDYSVSSPGKVKIDFYFIPHVKRPLPISDDLKRIQFSECYDD